MNKFTRFNHTVSAQAVHRVIHHLIDDIAYTWLQDNWKQKKDGTFHKTVNTSLNSYIESIIVDVEKEIFTNYGKQIKIRVWQDHHSVQREVKDYKHLKPHNDPSKVVFFVDATYRVVDTSGENSHSVGYVESNLYVYKHAPEFDKDRIPVLKQAWKDTYPIRQPDEVQETLLKQAEIELQINALTEEKRNISREFGYTYFEK